MTANSLYGGFVCLSAEEVVDLSVTLLGPRGAVGLCTVTVGDLVFNGVFLKGLWVAQRL